MSSRTATDLTLGLLAIIAGALFLALGEDGVAITLDVLGVICLAGGLNRLSAG